MLCKPNDFSNLNLYCEMFATEQVTVYVHFKSNHGKETKKLLQEN